MPCGKRAFGYSLVALAAVLVAGFPVPLQANPEGYAPADPWADEIEAPLPENSAEPRALTINDIESLLPEKTRDAKHASSVRSKEKKRSEKPSALEELYSSRIIDPLEQFGYDVFGEVKNFDSEAIATLPPGSVSDTFVLSAGDKIEVVLRGQDNSRKIYTINSEGLLILDDFQPLPAAGKTIAQVRQTLEAESAAMHNMAIYISLAGIRQIGVLVAGHVSKPGRVNQTAFNTVLDALSAAGGVQKTGSLRGIRLIRRGHTDTIDLYNLLLNSGDNSDHLLQDGDRIVVPPIGPTVGIGGAVKRPAIYEIKPNEKLKLPEMINLAGGLISPGQYRNIRLQFTSDGEEKVTDITDIAQPAFSDGSILNIVPSEAKRADTVTLSGHTRQPGTHDLGKAQTLSALIDDEKVLGPDIYPLIGVIERRDAGQMAKQLVDFPPRLVLTGDFDRRLANGDIVHLFSVQQVRALAPSPETTLQKISFAADTKIESAIIADFLKERSAFVRGSVRQPGAYPVAEGITLESVLAVAGGITLEGNGQNIEITTRLQEEEAQKDGHSGSRRITVDLRTTNPADVRIGPGDTIRVNQKFHRIEDQSVLLIGEVRFPGRYDLMPGDSVAKLIDRAGGLSEQAYPDGSIFSRASERKREEARFRAQGRDLAMKLAASLQEVDKDKKPDMTQVSAVQSLIGQLEQAQGVGRITVETDPGVLSRDPEQDMLLEAGDKLFIPKRPLNVRVGGEVLSPAALQFRKDKMPVDYIEEAGGFTYYADKDRTFVIYPDGSAQPLAVNAWNHRPALIPPGSTIIVPRDPSPFDFLESAEKISQILANLAITGFYIDDLGDDD